MTRTSCSRPVRQDMTASCVHSRSDSRAPTRISRSSPARPGSPTHSIDERFRDRVRPTDWRWLASKPIDGAKPVHAFHVLDVFPRVGLIRGGQIDGVLQTMDSCRIRWGRVLDRIGDQLIVSATRLELHEGRLRHGPPTIERVQAWRDATGFIDVPEQGDVVSIHWSWACDRLDRRQSANLIAWTDRQLAIANRTI